MSATEGKGRLGRWWRMRGRFGASHLLLAAFACTTLAPFLWMVVASMKPLDAVEELSPIPTDRQKARHVETQQLASRHPSLATLAPAEKLAFYAERLGAERVEAIYHAAVRDEEDHIPPERLRDAETIRGKLDGLSTAARERFLDALAAEEFSLLHYYAHHATRNYPAVWNSKDIAFKKYYFNSLFVAGWVTLLQCLTSALAAYAFSRLHWRGRDAVFKLYLGTMMIPGVVTMIPNYTLMVKLGLLDSYVGLIVPAAFSAFGTFLLRQFMMTIPPSLDEAATIDGASHWQVFWDIILPLARPGLIVLSIFTFMGNYGSFFWPLVLIKSEHLRTLPIGMLYYDTSYGNQTNLIMAASVMNILPLVLLFILMQKHLVKGIQLGAVKG